MCCISSEPTEDPTGRLRTFNGQVKFQTPMLTAPCKDCPTSCCWFTGQFIPATCGITQCMLRKKVLLGDMTKYSCFQGYFNCCCLKAGSCGEESCPHFCAFMEGCCCNFMAVSASRIYVMERYDLGSDPCDYRLIRINNCLQMIACFCTVASYIMPELRDIAQLINLIADVFYHTVSGCMTAQVAYEIDYQLSTGGANKLEAAGNQQQYVQNATAVRQEKY
mmetsp:Transcript_11115/g.24691  ORF Transcript_11115/g.24691 Transcript_11115/m.24691 type:complete len:221 (+) Transcript_11115:148-810(+)|eukprot:CAMPEP_0173194630 /NCGR_PEP_ID=MMETSP1141-20130122/14611_1 /TAXON_ID=483371 /ORGANISM="non described non described, Strain CCMP2298" /LENGTH=220 /DNA_ID=CAMNT_0014119079 /DNA_START=123 /DNA_END=785 /DNA_ORIENTATION=-